MIADPAPPDGGRFVVVGGGLAGLRAVETARKQRPDLAVTLVAAERTPPYDRPPLSKELLSLDAARSHSQFRPLGELRDELGVDVRLGTVACDLDVAARTLRVGDAAGDAAGFATVGYDVLVLATGSVPHRLPGTDGLDGCHELRCIEDSRAIRAALDAHARVVVVGAGFIGSEIASAARARDLEVIVVEALDTPLERAVGAEVGARCARLHRAHGTTLRTGVGVEAIDGDGRVEHVRLADGSVLDADLVVVGIGARPDVDWLAGSGLELDDGVVCDEYLRTRAPGVYAAGDITRWANPVFDRRMRVEHWTNAAEQGVRAARNALDPAGAEPYAAVPYVWSDQYGSRLQLLGVATEERVEIVVGELDADRFLALYRDGDRLTGVFGLNAQRYVMRFRTLIADGASVTDAIEFAGTLPPPKQEGT